MKRRRRRSQSAPPGVPTLGVLAPDELATIVADLARAAVQLVETADALVTAPEEARPALRATLYRWQTVLALGAQRLTASGAGRG